MPGSGEIEVFDLSRILFGEQPWLFTFEITVRTFIMYGYTIVMVRLISHRAVGQLSLAEFLLVIALGSAVGDPMFYADVPVLHGLIVITVVVLMNRGIAELTARNDRLDTLLEGRPHHVVREGVIQVESLIASNMAHEELFQALREQGVEQMGEVRAAYLEQDGKVSVFRFSPQEARAGLAIEPPFLIAPPPRFGAGELVPRAGVYACARCARVEAIAAGESFAVDHCGSDVWLDRVANDHAPA